MGFAAGTRCAGPKGAMGDFDFPLNPSGLPLPLKTTRDLRALDPGLLSIWQRFIHRGATLCKNEQSQHSWRPLGEFSQKQQGVSSWAGQSLELTPRGWSGIPKGDSGGCAPRFPLWAQRSAFPLQPPQKRKKHEVASCFQLTREKRSHYALPVSLSIIVFLRFAQRVR